jgi:hypothetical protein
MYTIANTDANTENDGPLLIQMTSFRYKVLASRMNLHTDIPQGQYHRPNHKNFIMPN